MDSKNPKSHPLEALPPLKQLLISQQCWELALGLVMSEYPEDVPIEEAVQDFLETEEIPETYVIWEALDNYRLEEVKELIENFYYSALVNVSVCIGIAMNYKEAE